eukprot:13990912-Ditylum_brightwellii.AAC.1
MRKIPTITGLRMYDISFSRLTSDERQFTKEQPISVDCDKTSSDIREKNQQRHKLVHIISAAFFGMLPNKQKSCHRKKKPEY